MSELMRSFVFASGFLFGPSTEPSDWRIAAVYDLSAVGHADGAAQEYAWIPTEGMTGSCGPAKAPDGLGVFEAQAASSGLTPVLAVVLEGPSDAPALTPEVVRVAVGRGSPEVALQPMVLPRLLAVDIQYAPGLERYAQLVRTQLEVETCMEHKTGRGWRGHDSGRIRQALLLAEPGGTDRSRRYFGGQQDPIGALLGPPDACLVRSGDDEDLAPVGAGRGEASLDLTPADVWGASLRRCSDSEFGGALAAGDASRNLPLRTSAPGDVAPSDRPWQGLEVSISLAEGTSLDEEERVRVSVRLDGRELLTDSALFSEPDEDGRRGLTDLLAQVPYEYPVVRSEGRDEAYTVLLVPNWQLVEGLRRLERDGVAPDEPMKTPGAGVLDGVAHVLANPDRLFVQLAPASGDATDWPNLIGVMQSDVLGQPVGYTVGSLAARSHIVLVGEQPPTVRQLEVAQRSRQQAALLGSCVVLLVAFVAGLMRISDLWTRSPDERANFWPGPTTVKLVDNVVESLDSSEEKS